MRNFLFTKSLAAVALLAWPAFAKAVDVPCSLVGTWDVVHVAVNRRDQQHWLYRPDDPILMGRELIIEANAIRFGTDVSATCSPTGMTKQRETWGNLMDIGFPRGEAVTRPSDYGLRVSPKAKVDIYSICPLPKEKIRAGFESIPLRDDVWIVQSGPNAIHVKYTSDTLLIFQRRLSGAKQTPSFQCKKAVTAAEKTICSSFMLSGLDRSVAAQWTFRTKTNGPTVEQIEDQKAWLKQRDSCGTSVACLNETMTNRITNIPPFR